MGAGEALVGSQSPAAFRRALGAANEAGLFALLGHFVVLQQSAVQLRLDDLCPADALREAELLVLQHRHTSGPDHFERAQVQRVQRRLDDVKCGKVFRQLAPADRFQIAEVGQVAEFRVRRLDVDESRDFLQSREDFQPVRLHARVARTEREIGVNLLESGERVVQDRDGSFDDGAVPEALDVARVDDVDALARLGARPVADDAFPVDGLLLGRADADAGPVVLEQMLGTRFDAGGAVGVLAFRVRLPRVRDRIVALHCRTFLFADTIVEKVAASLEEELNVKPTSSTMFFFCVAIPLFSRYIKIETVIANSCRRTRNSERQ